MLLFRAVSYCMGWQTHCLYMCVRVRTCAWLSYEERKNSFCNFSDLARWNSQPQSCGSDRCQHVVHVLQQEQIQSEPDDAQGAMLHPRLLSIVPWEAPQILRLMSCCASGGWLQTVLEFQDLVWQISRQKKPLRWDRDGGKKGENKRENKQTNKQKTGREQRARKRDLGRQKAKGKSLGKKQTKREERIYFGESKK